MPEQVLYGIISFLGLAVLTLSGLWIRTADKHREWATSKIADHTTIIAVVQTTNLAIKESMSEIRVMLKDHLAIEQAFQREVVTRWRKEDGKT